MSFPRINICLLCILTCLCASAQENKELSIEMNKIKCSFQLDEQGAPVYSVFYGAKPVILSSHLGFRLVEDSGFYKNFSIIRVEKRSVDENWQPVWGETKTIRNHYGEIKVHLQQLQAPNRLLNIIFRVFEDGVGFRYEFPKQPNLKYFIVADELSH